MEKIDDGLGGQYKVTNATGTLTFEASKVGADAKVLTQASTHTALENAKSSDDVLALMKNELATAKIGTDTAKNCYKEYRWNVYDHKRNCKCFRFTFIQFTCWIRC